MSNPVGFRSIEQLDDLARSITLGMKSHASNIQKLFDHQISLLEIFNHEIKKYQRIKYCDFELCYVCYKITDELTKLNEGHLRASKELNESIREALLKKRDVFEDIKSFLVQAGVKQSPQANNDPLVAKFKSLKASTSQTLNHSNTEFNQRQLKYRESITARELHKLLYEDNGSSHKVLLIDFREAKEYHHNHIKHNHIINIEPSIVDNLLHLNPGALDDELLAKLKFHLSDEQYRTFQNRHQYDSIVLYNFKYGVANDTDRLTNLKAMLIDYNLTVHSSNNPFTKFIDLIMFRNKYISSRLKSYPCYLSGGILYFHLSYGDKVLARTNQDIIKPPASLSRNGSNYIRNGTGSESSFISKSNSPYLKDFSLYLSSAKSNSNTPVSGSFYLNQPPLIDYMKTSSLYNGLNVTKVVDSKPPEQQQIARRRSSSSFRLSEKPKSSKGSTQNLDPVIFLEQYTTGLTNLGNSCYMNCILQCLGATPQLTNFFFPTLNLDSSNSSQVQSYRQHINVSNKLGTKGILTTNFVTLLMNMFNNAGKYFTPSSFKKVVGSLSPGNQFATFDQQDCLEFLNFILDGLHEDLNQMVVSDPEERKRITELTPEEEKNRELLPVRLSSTIEWERYLKLNFSIIVDYFQGQFLSHLKCLECNLTSTTYNAFSILSLPIPEKLGSVKDVLLDECFQEFVTTELLDEDNKWYCPRCKQFTRLSKKLTITRLPQVLILHFKRFKMTTNGYINKLDTFIKYPVNDVLDLTSYWPSIGTYVEDDIKNRIISPEKEHEILSSLPTRNQEPPFRYKLYGVANHFGTLTTGHYTSYVKKKDDSKKTKGWCYFDDEKVTFNCKESQVLNKNAYCLFYQRV